MRPWGAVFDAVRFAVTLNSAVEWARRTRAFTRNPTQANSNAILAVAARPTTRLRRGERGCRRRSPVLS